MVDEQIEFAWATGKDEERERILRIINKSKDRFVGNGGIKLCCYECDKMYDLDELINMINKK